MKKSDLSEQDIRTKFIMPAIKSAGWNVQNQLREEYSFTDGKIRVRGQMVTRGQGKRADYILYHTKGNIPLAVIEAKSNKNTLGTGLTQALDYAKILDIPFAFSSNGDGFIQHDRTISTSGDGKKEQRIGLDDFPTPRQLWAKYKDWKGIEEEEQEQMITQPYYYEKGGLRPRYYQRIAINRTIEAIAKGQKRIMLVMATGTGKTLTAFQIIWRIWENGGNGDFMPG